MKWLPKCYINRKPVVLAVNKVDNPEMRNEIYDFYSLGFGEPYPISGSHGLGLGDLLDEVVKHFKDEEPEPYDDDTIRLSIIGRPNVGKSSLVNAILGEERVIVSNAAVLQEMRLIQSIVMMDRIMF